MKLLQTKNKETNLVYIPILTLNVKRVNYAIIRNFQIELNNKT